MDPIELTRRITEAVADAHPNSDEVAVITFHVDDQTPEDLAIGLDRVRALDGVLDVNTVMVGGKKGRLGFRAEVLVRPESAPEAIRACLVETSTIGLRWYVAQRITLKREQKQAIGAGGRCGQIKTVIRPEGQLTTKLEADVLNASDLDHAGRQRLRIELESSTR